MHQDHYRVLFVFTVLFKSTSFFLLVKQRVMYYTSLIELPGISQTMQYLYSYVCMNDCMHARSQFSLLLQLKPPKLP